MRFFKHNSTVMSNNNNNIVNPKSSTINVVIANEAAFTFFKILLDFAPTMNLSLQSEDIPAAKKRWKKVTSTLQLVATDIEQAQQKQGSLSI
jgi:hypothetical protein